ncbi:hypothetical protein CMEL01_13956 [Colletotrichum melonis]|uniref:Uncharacterized protein n=1 Tax=Colletotrichum melonis TaxID=1209925 RepID=A0AAI9XX96_9PEZI|nr:hypothetical protein CMEL01_13956 [Colletotrichum melonis]
MATGNPPELSLTPRQRVTSRYCHDFPYFGHAQSKISGNSRLREQNPVALGCTDTTLRRAASCLKSNSAPPRPTAPA